jgi:hypothetical protein
MGKNRFAFLCLLLGIHLYGQGTIQVSKQKILLDEVLCTTKENEKKETELLAVEFLASQFYPPESLYFANSTGCDYINFWLDVYENDSLINSFHPDDYNLQGNERAASSLCNGNNLHTIKVPVHLLNLRKGKHTLELKISAQYTCDAHTFYEISTTRTHINMPELVRVSFRATDFSISDSAVDPASPLGLFSSTQGHGYADTYFEITDDRKKIYYTSGVYTNQLQIPAIQGSFNITPNTPLVLKIWDDDDWSFDDKLGEFTLKKAVVGSDSSVISIKNKHILGGKLSLLCRKFPQLNLYQSTLIPHQFKGVSGVKIETTCKLGNVQPNDQVIQSISTSGQNKQPLNVLIDYKKLNIGNEIQVNLSQFIPYALLVENAGTLVSKLTVPSIGFDLPTTKIKNQLVVPHEVEDVKFALPPPLYTKINNESGIQIQLKTEVPALYTMANFYLEISVKDEEGNNYTDSLLLLPQNTLSPTLYNAAQASFYWLLPYRCIAHFENLQNLEIEARVKLEKNNFQIGHTTQSLPVNKTDFISMGNYTYQLQPNKSFTGSLAAEVWYNDKLLTRFNLEGKKGGFDLHSFLFHPGDAPVQIRLMEISSDTQTSQVIYTLLMNPQQDKKWTIKKEDLTNGAFNKMMITKK